MTVVVTLVDKHTKETHTIKWSNKLDPISRKVCDFTLQQGAPPVGEFYARMTRLKTELLLYPHKAVSQPADHAEIDKTIRMLKDALLWLSRFGDDMAYRVIVDWNHT